MLTLPQEPGPRHRLYETMVEHIYGQELSAGDSFIDLGGNIGHHTWRMAVAVGSEGRGFAICLLYTSPSPRDATLSRMPSSA